MTTRSLVLLCGGRDSTPCLARVPARLRETFPVLDASCGGCPARELRAAGGHRWQRTRSR